MTYNKEYWMTFQQELANVRRCIRIARRYDGITTITVIFAVILFVAGLVAEDRTTSLVIVWAALANVLVCAGAQYQKVRWYRKANEANRRAVGTDA